MQIKKRNVYSVMMYSNYTNAMIKMLKSMGIICNNAEEAYQARSQFSLKQRRGGFKQIGLLLNISPKQAKDYYLNTWIQPFFEDVVQYRKEIYQIVILYKYLDIDQVEQCFQEQYPGVMFNIHKLRRIINQAIKKYKNKLLKNKECLITCKTKIKYNNIIDTVDFRCFSPEL